MTCPTVMPAGLVAVNEVRVVLVEPKTGTGRRWSRFRFDASDLSQHLEVELRIALSCERLAPVPVIEGATGHSLCA